MNPKETKTVRPLRTGYLSTWDILTKPKALWALIRGHDRRAKRLMERAGAALDAGDRRAFYRLGVAAVDEMNAWRTALGWQLLYVSEYSRTVAEGRMEPHPYPSVAEADSNVPSA